MTCLVCDAKTVVRGISPEDEFVKWTCACKRKNTVRLRSSSQPVSPIIRAPIRGPEADLEREKRKDNLLTMVKAAVVVGVLVGASYLTGVDDNYFASEPTAPDTSTLVVDDVQRDVEACSGALQSNLANEFSNGTGSTEGMTGPEAAAYDSALATLSPPAGMTPDELWDWLSVDDLAILCRAEIE